MTYLLLLYVHCLQRTYVQELLDNAEQDYRRAVEMAMTPLINDSIKFPSIGQLLDKEYYGMHRNRSGNDSAWYNAEQHIQKRQHDSRPYQLDDHADFTVVQNDNDNDEDGDEELPRLFKRSVSKTLKVVTWTAAHDQYATAINETVSMQRPLWVTIVPQFQQFCMGRNESWYSVGNSSLYDPLNSKRILRLQEFMGMPPQLPSTRNSIVTMQVKLKYLTRPCLNGKIKRQSCQLTEIVESPDGNLRLFINGTKSGLDNSNRNVSEHQRWFYNLAVNSGVYDYQSEFISSIFPWTRLGYTFDYGRDAKRAGSFGVGAMELLIVEGARVRIKSVESIYDYCQK
ncbi:hypothetical protein MIR68_001241 [Amoeboaphelidium protococcarum]|nr:hypothetical protein MIR68_001241 [Amoeboaphelidium protococcarum]